MSVRSLRYNTMNQHFTKSALASTDRDALAFLEAAQIYNTNQQRAIVNLVRSLKRVGLWSKMKAIYPFVGGTASSHKWNLKDPRDADAAFRLSFSGGWTHSSNGSKGNGTNTFADTFLTPSTHLNALDAHCSIYARGTNPTNIIWDYYLLGSYNSNTPTSFYAIDNGQNPAGNRIVYTGAGVDASRAIATNNNDQGFIVASITSSATNAHKQYYNGTNTASNTNTSTARSNLKTYLGVLNFSGGLYGYSNQDIAFATMGDGLTDTDATNLYNIVDLYQKRLGRAV